MDALNDPKNHKKIEVFFSYSHKDQPLRDELANHLSGMQRNGVIEPWHDRQISPGNEWAGLIDDHLNWVRLFFDDARWSLYQT